MNEIVLDSPLLFYVYLFWRNSGEDVVNNALGNNQIPSTILGMDSMHMDVCKVYKQKVCPKALHAIILPFEITKSLLIVFSMVVHFHLLD
jgi:hypothetical protein